MRVVGQTTVIRREMKIYYIKTLDDLVINNVYEIKHC